MNRVDVEEQVARVILRLDPDKKALARAVASIRNERLEDLPPETRRLLMSLARVLVSAAHMEVAAAVRERFIPRMVQSFLAWPLPKSVCADPCVTTHDYPYRRTGTNLLTGAEAEEMVKHVLSDALVRVETIGGSASALDGATPILPDGTESVPVK